MFAWVRDILGRMATRKKAKDEWATYYANDAYRPTNRQPLDPDNDPWRS